MVYNNFKDKISDVATNNQINTSDQILVGVVTEADEVANCCSVKFVSQYGYVDLKHFVPVVTEANNGLIGWFPSIGDSVYVRLQSNNRYEIISLCTSNYASKHRHTIDIKNNLLSNFYNYTIGGNIF